MTVVTNTQSAVRAAKKANRRNAKILKHLAAIETYLGKPQIPTTLPPLATAATTAVTALQTAVNSYLYP